MMYKHLPQQWLVIQTERVSATSIQSFKITLLTTHTARSDYKLLFQEYFMKLPVVNSSFFLLFFCFFPPPRSSVAPEGIITKLVGVTTRINMHLSALHFRNVDVTSRDI